MTKVSLTVLRPSYSNPSIPIHDENVNLGDLGLSDLLEIIGGLSEPSKMPGYSYSLSAFRCKTGDSLAKVEGSACFKCYARKGNYVRFPAIQVAMERRYNSLFDARWVSAFIRVLSHYSRRGHNVFRWHDSGDIQSVSHLRNIVKVAENTPNIRHWIPSREYQMIDEYKRLFGEFPPNLVVRVSAHMNGTLAPKRYNNTSSILPKGMTQEEMEENVGRKISVCPAYTQNGVCGDCRNCWDSSLDLVVYPQH
jgi:hypothetical protein